MDEPDRDWATNVRNILSKIESRTPCHFYSILFIVVVVVTIVIPPEKKRFKMKCVLFITNVWIVESTEQWVILNGDSRCHWIYMPSLILIRCHNQLLFQITSNPNFNLFCFHFSRCWFFSVAEKWSTDESTDAVVITSCTVYIAVELSFCLCVPL